MIKIRSTLLAVLLIVCHCTNAQTIEEDFIHPPEEAKPLMIWQWMDGLISKEGITADLEAYKKAGRGGVQNFQVGGRLQAMAKDTTNAIGSESWKQLMKFAMTECKRLGLSFGTHNCPGWSSSAFPTVKPEFAMQKLIWSKTVTKKRKKVRLETPAVDPQYDYYRDVAVVAIPDADTIPIESVLILTEKMDENGVLHCRLPKGIWRIYRFGHTPNGQTNWGTSPESGVGLECDKMNREAVKHFWNTYPSMLLDLAGEEAGTTFRRLEIDSYEAGSQDWTMSMPNDFKEKRGYDIIPWLPVADGVVINSKQQTETFLHDWHETVSDLFAENYYGYMSQLAHENGLQLLVQPYGTGGAGSFNPINTDKICRGLAKDDPISAEFWTQPRSWGWKEVPQIVNAARKVGRQLIYAEGFTCWPLYAWKDDPNDLKATADLAFCLGINKLMLHAGAHNPWVNRKPGMTFGMWGTQWTPGQTWWKDGAKALFSYFARCQALLQRGVYVDDYKSKNPSLSVPSQSIQWIHRQDENNTDIYFVANTSDSSLISTFTINGTGRIPELWNPETGSIAEAEGWSFDGGNTLVRLNLTSQSSSFIILRRNTKETGPGLVLPQRKVIENIPLNGKWTVRFDEGKNVEMTSLTPWDESSDMNIKYFSGTACYSQQVHLKKDKHCRYVLNLGEVKNLAVVSVNGVECGKLWRPPFSIDITDALREGDNTLEIDVTNLWVNRMIGDENEMDDVEWSEPFSFSAAPKAPYIGRFMKQVPEWLKMGLPRPSSKRKAVISFKFFEKGDPLLRSGMIGPVVLSKQEGKTF